MLKTDNFVCASDRARFGLADDSRKNGCWIGALLISTKFICFFAKLAQTLICR